MSKEFRFEGWVGKETMPSDILRWSHYRTDNSNGKIKTSHPMNKKPIYKDDKKIEIIIREVEECKGK